MPMPYPNPVPPKPRTCQRNRIAAGSQSSATDNLTTMLQQDPVLTDQAEREADAHPRSRKPTLNANGESKRQVISNLDPRKVCGPAGEVRMRTNCYPLEQALGGPHT